MFLSKPNWTFFLFHFLYKVVVGAHHANLRVSARVYDVKGGAFFSKNGFFGTTHGDAWTPRLRSPFLIMAPDGRYS